MFSGNEKITWFNSFFASQRAFEIIKKNLKKNLEKNINIKLYLEEQR